MGYLAVILGAYLMGSSSMAFYLGKLTKKDVAKNGSGNLGASNTLILLGWQAGVLVGIHDIGKGVLAVLLAKWIFGVPYAGELAGVACVLGHIFPFYLKFKGGKGLASYIGMTVALNWKLAIVVVVLLVLITLITDYIVLGTMTTILVVPGVTFFSAWIPALILCIATLVMVFKHTENFSRLKNGTEIGFRGAAKGKHRLK